MSLIVVRRRPGVACAWQGLLSFRGQVYPCSLGRSGIVSRKFEGDGGTPSGRFKVLYGYHRRDRFRFPISELPMIGIRNDDGWCDEPNHPSYNSPVSLPHPASHEEMMRSDRLYDVCLVLDYNIHPRARARGSAIFFHLTREDLGPTEGCIAIEPAAMKRLLPDISWRTQILICP